MRGPQGVPGPAGPTAVSIDAANVATIGTDGLIHVSQTTLDTRYVNVTGDTMTGALAIKPPAGTSFTVAVENARPLFLFEGSGDQGNGPNFTIRRSRGTITAPTAVAVGDELGIIRFNSVGTYTPSTLNQRALLRAQVLSAGTATLPPDTRLTLGSVSPDGSKSAAVTLDALATNAVSINISTDNFKVATTGYTTILDGLSVTRSQSGTGGTFNVSGAGAGQTGAGIVAVCKGGSATTGSITGIYAESSGTVGTGIGVDARALGVATTNIAIQAQASGGTNNIGISIADTIPKAANSFALSSVSKADSYFAGNLGVGWSTPTVPLEVGGAAKVRGALEVVGNITATGAAHSFAAGSIPASAVAGIVAATPASAAAPGTAGSVRYDAGFLYVCVAANTWRRVALAAW
jgi:hypothetical protein